MKRLFCSFAIPVLALLVAGAGHAQTFPVVKGTMEYQVGLAGVALAENEGNPGISAQPEIRVGRFLVEGIELQVAGDVRIWPGGTQAGSSYGVSGNLLWFPKLGAGHRNLYLLAGAGGALADPPGPEEGSSFDPMFRGGIGMKIPLSETGAGFLSTLHLSVEFREEIVSRDETEYLSGISFAVSQFR